MNSRAADDVAPARVEPGGSGVVKGRPSARSTDAKTQAAVKGLSADKFGALRSPEGSYRPSVDDALEEYSTGSCTPVEYPSHICRKRTYQNAVQITGGGSSWSTYSRDSESQAAGATCRSSNPVSDSDSTPVSCTLHESETPTRSDIAVPPPVKTRRTFCSAPLANHHQGVQELLGESYFLSQNELVGQSRGDHDESNQRVSARLLPTTKSRYSDDPSRIALLPTPTLRFRIDRNNTALGPATASMGSESSLSARHSEESSGRSRVRFNYKFASADLEASLFERMEARQRLMDETREPERCCHVISPEDLVWGSVKHYIGMVLDRETNSLLGTAVLFVAPDQRRKGSQSVTFSNSAWVTCVQVVAGRTEVRVKNSRGGVHMAQLVLTSTALGLALFSVNVWQGTFALAFLSRVSGPASLPHRPFVDVDRSDRVYVIGYEKPWESEDATTADARVRPGRIVEAGRHTIVEIDFTTGRLGGSIDSPAGFRGALVVRADGLLAGVVTSELLSSHRTNIDFASAYNVYALLEEL